LRGYKHVRERNAAQFLALFIYYAWFIYVQSDGKNLVYKVVRRISGAKEKGSKIMEKFM
jgi:hypothetical protein